MTLTEIQDAVARQAFGMTMAEAKAKGICISCKKPPALFTVEGHQEYRNSSLCEPCFDRIMEQARDMDSSD